MNFCEIYRLKSDAAEKDVFACVKNALDKFAEGANIPNDIVWTSHENDRFVEFISYFGCDVKIKIIFDTEEKRLAKTNPFHNLVYMEENNTEKFFCVNFFSGARNLLLGKKPKQQFYEEKHLAKKENCEKENCFGANRIIFRPDKKGSFLLSKKEIETVMNDLWFLGERQAQFVWGADVKWRFEKACKEKHGEEKYASMKKFEKKMQHYPDGRKVFSEEKEKGLNIWLEKNLDEACAKIIVSRAGAETLAVAESVAPEILRDKILSAIETPKEYVDFLKKTEPEICEKIFGENSTDSAKFNAAVSACKQNYENQISKISDGLKKANEENERLSAENKNLREANEGLKQQLEAANSRKAAENASENEKASGDVEISQANSDEIKNLQTKISALEEQNKKLADEKSSLERRISELQEKITRKQNDSGDIIALEIPCKEKNLFPDEIQDYLYALLYSKIDEENKNFPVNKEDENYRIRDVVKALSGDNMKKFDWEKTKTAQKIERIEKILKGKPGPRIFADLKKEGFENVGTNKHPQFLFYNDNRYKKGLPLSPSDRKDAVTDAKEIERRFFLVPVSAQKGGA